MTLCLPAQDYQYRPSYKTKSPDTFWFWAAIIVFVALFASMYLNPGHAYDAYIDIIDNERFEGNIREIEWLVQILDKGIIWIISFIGFFIISSAMLRNVLSGCYAAFPRLFDMLAETKEQFKNSKDQQGGMLKYVLSFVIPNIKPLTDFADGTASPRGYFTKSILLGVVTVIIGVCVYNGLYRDLIKQGAQLGTHVISNYILKIDFTREFDKIMETGRMYKFVWANSKAEGDKSRQKIAKAVYMKAIDMHGDVRTTESRTQVGTIVESKLMEFFKTGESAIGVTNKDLNTGDMSEFFDSTSWDCIIEVSDSSATNGRSGSTADPNLKYFMSYWTLAELTGLTGDVASATGMDQRYIYAFITFRRNDLSDGKGPGGGNSEYNDGATATVSVLGFPKAGGQDFAFNIAKDPADKETKALSQSGTYTNGTIVIKVEASNASLNIAAIWNSDEGIKASSGIWTPPSEDSTRGLTLAELCGSEWTAKKSSVTSAMVNYGGYTTISDFKFVAKVIGETPKCMISVSEPKKPEDTSSSSSGDASSSSKAEE